MRCRGKKTKSFCGQMSWGLVLKLVHQFLHWRMSPTLNLGNVLGHLPVGHQGSGHTGSSQPHKASTGLQKQRTWSGELLSTGRLDEPAFQGKHFVKTLPSRMAAEADPLWQENCTTWSPLTCLGHLRMPVFTFLYFSQNKNFFQWKKMKLN